MFRIAYDYELDNPNPHAWRLGSEDFQSFEAAQDAGDHEDAAYEHEYGHASEVGWVVIEVGL